VSFWILYFGWSVSVFVGNYVFYRIGIMSFLPWLNNFIHTFLWIGICLGTLYAGSYRESFLKQFVLFATFSLIVKVFERTLLGTWELDHFFGMHGNGAYIVGWSLLDGLYPAISAAGLKMISQFNNNVVVAT
jgi:hypothetical protein